MKNGMSTSGIVKNGLEADSKEKKYTDAVKNEGKDKSTDVRKKLGVKNLFLRAFAFDAEGLEFKPWLSHTGEYKSVNLSFLLTVSTRM